MDWLARREYGEQELRSRLERAGFDALEVDGALQTLQDDGLQCDERYTEVYVNQRRSRGFGPLRIRAELRSRGVDDLVVNHHLSVSDPCWFETAELACMKRFGDAVIESFEEKGKRIRFLQQRGFTQEQTEHAIEVCQTRNEQ